MNNQMQKIITFIPLIHGYLKHGATYNEIVNILKKEHDFIIQSKNPSNYLGSIMSQNSRMLLNKTFAKFKVLKVFHKDKSIYNEFCAESKYGFYLTYQDIPVNEQYIITPNNIHSITDIKGCLIAKRVLRFHLISDTQIINNYKLTYNITEFGKDDINFIKSIHNNILHIFEDLFKELRLKPYFYKDLL